MLLKNQLVSLSIQYFIERGKWRSDFSLALLSTTIHTILLKHISVLPHSRTVASNKS